MKKITLAVVAVSFGAMSVSAVPQSPRAAALSMKYPLQAEAASTQLWRPGTECFYEWSENGEWEKTESYNTTYDRMGNTLVRTNYFLDGNGVPTGGSRTICEYPEGSPYFINRTTETSSDGINWTPSQLCVRAYDDRLPSVITSNEEFSYLNGGWVKNGNNYIRTIERNEAGNVTSVTVATLYMGVYDPVDRLTVTYGDNGQATEILHEVLTTSPDGTFVWGKSGHYADIEWECTDGQFSSLSTLPNVNNRIKSARIWIENYNDSEMWSRATYTYPDNRGSFVSTSTYAFDNMPVRQTVTYKVMDSNGSYELETLQQGGVGSIQMSYGSKEKYYVDDYGLETLVYASEIDGANEYVLQNTVGSVEYDPVNGYPLVYTVSDYMDDMDSFVNVFKIEFGDYVDAAGVGDTLIGDDSGHAVEYYDLRGIRVDSPDVPGVYICRRGDSVTKVLVR